MQLILRLQVLTLERFQGVRYSQEVRMQLVPLVSLLSFLVTMPTGVAGRQDHHASADRRSARVMGFDQERTTHHFLVFTDGGAIDIGVKDPLDVADRDAIRSHLPHIAAMFADGDFNAPMLVHDSAIVPGTTVMAARKDTIRYQYVETANGGRVDIVTNDPEALAAVHAFLRFQIAEHKTGDQTAVRTR